MRKYIIYDIIFKTPTQKCILLKNSINTFSFKMFGKNILDDMRLYKPIIYKLN